VGVLIGLEFTTPILDGLKAGMGELGYVEGENIVYEVQVTNFDIPTYQAVLQKFVDDKVDLIVVTPTEASIEAKAIAEGTGIPVVFTFALAEGTGLIESVHEPGGNITGVRYPGIDITVKRYEMMRQLVPNATRFWLPYQKGYPIVLPQLEALKPLAEADGVTLVEFPADSGADLQAELEKLAALDDPGVDAIFFLVEPRMVSFQYFGAENFRSLNPGHFQHCSTQTSEISPGFLKGYH
jgi:putative ABC transport system substrate-binding protein